MNIDWNIIVHPSLPLPSIVYLPMEGTTNYISQICGKFSYAE